MVTGWTHGNQARVFPDVAGYKIGDGAARWLVLEVHIDNTKGVAGRRYASGVRLHTTSKLRENDVGTLVVVRCIERDGAFNQVLTNGC